MTPIVFASDAPHDILTEYDECSMCGKATDELVSVRLFLTLESFCRTCVLELGAAMVELMKRRDAWRARHPEEVS